MDGQWIGECVGTNPGTVIVDIDDCGSHFQGTAALFDKAGGMPGSFIRFRTADKGHEQHLDSCVVNPLHPANYNIIDRHELLQLYQTAGQDLSFPLTARVSLNLRGDTLHANWTTDIGTSGAVEMPRSRASQPSEVSVSPKVSSWGSFKEVAASIERGRYIFRGQPSTWRLRTAFHRTKRKDLARFMDTDIPRLHQVLSGQTKHLFNLMDSMQNGAFWNLGGKPINGLRKA